MVQEEVDSCLLLMSCYTSPWRIRFYTVFNWIHENLTQIIVSEMWESLK